MKIHIVQKGDTLWKIAKHYGVDFEELKRLNTQLSNPEQIMPGMKIKIPGHSTSVEKNKSVQHHHKGSPAVPQKSMPAPAPHHHQHKEMPPKAKTQPKKAVEVPLKAMPTVPVPMIETDDVKPPVEIKPEVPVYETPPQMPTPPPVQPQPIPQPQQQLQMPKIEFDMVQNQIYQQMQQMPQAPQVQSPPIQIPVQQPCPETPSQPQIQILPVYFYPIMPPVQPQPPMIPQPQPCYHEPSVCDTAPGPSPCDFTGAYGHPHMHAYHGHGFYDHGMHGGQGHGQSNVQNSWNFIPGHAPELYERGLMENEQACPAGSDQQRSDDSVHAANAGQPSSEQATANLSELRAEPEERTYYESMPRYFDEQNLYSPPSQPDSNEARNNFDEPNASQNPEQY